VPSLRKRAPRRSPAADPKDAAAAEQAAVALLARRDFAGGELSARLRERGFEPAVVEALLERLRARRLLNDERYAAHFVQYHSARGQGPVRIRRDLEAVGVEAALVEAALGAVPDWAALAREVRRRRFGAEPPQAWREKGRQARFLQYRGFSNDHIRTALGPDLEMDT
jgi:regulatory protein